MRLSAGSYTTIDANSYSCHVFEIPGTIDGIELHHIYAKDCNGVMKAGFNLSASGNGFVLNECKSTGCYRGISSMTSTFRSLLVLGGYYSSDTNSPIYFNLTYGVTLIGVTVKCTVNQPCIFVGGYANTLISGCAIIGNGNSACIGIKAGGSYSFCIADNNVIYNVGHGIEVANLTATLVEIGNIIVVAAKATGQAIKFTSGSVLYSDYSCLWALDGAPAATERWEPYGIGDNSIEANPQFEDAANDDFRLVRSSPCLRTDQPTLGQL